MGSVNVISGTFCSIHLFVFPISTHYTSTYFSFFPNLTYHSSGSTVNQLTEETRNLIMFWKTIIYISHILLTLFSVKVYVYIYYIYVQYNNDDLYLLELKCKIK